MPAPTIVLAALAGSFVLAVAQPGSATPHRLESYRWKSRLLLVSAPDPEDSLLKVQRHGFEAMRAEAQERDLVLVEAVGKSPQAETLRRRFDIDPTAFRVLLIGKDGSKKLTSATPLGPDRLFPVVDAMPMRREETRRKP